MSDAAFFTLVNRALPGALFALCHEHCREKGYVVREDMDLLVVRTIRDAVKGLDEPTRNRVLDRAAVEAKDILTAGNCDDANQMWVALAHGMLLASARGVRFPENVLLIATAAETELFEHADEYGGERTVQKAAALMDNVAWARGWWKSPLERADVPG